MPPTPTPKGSGYTGTSNDSSFISVQQGDIGINADSELDGDDINEDRLNPFHTGDY